jgi:hypothetical protein
MTANDCSYGAKKGRSPAASSLSIEVILGI